MRALQIQKSLTKRDEKSIGRYLNNISKFSVLSPEEEVALFKAFQAGDPQAKEKIIQHNLRFVVSVAKQYQHMGLKLSDLINEGNIGLIKATHRFDPSRGFKFISYAVWWIRQSILVAIKERARKIRVPGNVQTQLQRIESVQQRVRQNEEREASLDELADETDMTKDTIKLYLESTQKVAALDAPVTNDESYSRYQVMADSKIPLPDHHLTTKSSTRKILKILLNELPPRQSTILRQYFGIGQSFPHSLTQIADNLDISKERARQIKDRGLLKLRTKIRRRGIEFSFS